MSEQPEQINLKESVIYLLVSLLFLSLFFQRFFLFPFLLDLSFWLDMGTELTELTYKEIINYFIPTIVVVTMFVFIFLRSLSCFIRESIKISRWSVYKIKKRREV